MTTLCSTSSALWLGTLIARSAASHSAITSQEEEPEEGTERLAEPLAGPQEGAKIVVGQHPVPRRLGRWRFHRGHRRGLEDPALDRPGNEAPHVGEQPVDREITERGSG